MSHVGLFAVLAVDMLRQFTDALLLKTLDCSSASAGVQANIQISPPSDRRSRCIT